MIEDPFQSLLFPDEKILWSAEPAPFVSPNFGSNILALVALSVVGMCLIVIVADVVSARHAFDPLRYIGPFFGTIFGLFIFRSAIAGKLVLPRPRFMLTQRRAFIAKAEKVGWKAAARFLEPGRAILVRESGKHFELLIPVRPEEPRDNGFVVYNRLSKADCDAALAIVNAVIGRPNQ